MSLHKLLNKQLIRHHLDYTTLPSDLKKWQEFIENINKVYVESDEERYLVERSINISSRETMELNDKLENAQRIASLGHWVLDSTSGKVTWSKELRKLFGYSMIEAVPTYEEVLEMIHPQERNKLENLIKNCIANGTKYEIELRIKLKNGGYRWFYAVGEPYNCSRAPYNMLAGIAMDIDKHKNDEIEIEKLNQKLINAARQAGKAEVAISILDNVGNVLNSANVSIEILNENFGQPYYQDFFKVCELLKNNLSNITEYLSKDEKGKLIPEYLANASEAMSKEYTIAREELNNLYARIQHIKVIVASQQSIASQGTHSDNELGNVNDG